MGVKENSSSQEANCCFYEESRSTQPQIENSLIVQQRLRPCTIFRTWRSQNASTETPQNRKIIFVFLSHRLPTRIRKPAVIKYCENLQTCFSFFFSNHSTLHSQSSLFRTCTLMCISVTCSIVCGPKATLGHKFCNKISLFLFLSKAL